MNEFRSQRPQPRPAGLEQQPQQQQPQPASRQPVQQQTKKSRSGKALWIVIVLLVVAVLAAGVFWWMNRENSVVSQINQDKYQAVFFTNGQVYFGKLSLLGDDYFKLQDVYYLRTDSEDSKNPQKTTKQDAGDVQLIKLGTQEIHGPEDEMTISESQVLFFENIKDDGDVGKSISEYRKNQ